MGAIMNLDTSTAQQPNLSSTQPETTAQDTASTASRLKAHRRSISCSDLSKLELSAASQPATNVIPVSKREADALSESGKPPASTSTSLPSPRSKLSLATLFSSRSSRSSNGSAKASPQPQMSVMSRLRAFSSRRKDHDSTAGDADVVQKAFNQIRESCLLQSSRWRPPENDGSLFEAFFLVGCSAPEVASKLTQPGLLAKPPSSLIALPEILFRYPPGVDVNVAELPTFCFPTNIKVTKVGRSSSFSDVNEIIYSHSHLQSPDCSYTFALSSAERGVLYGMCVKKEELIDDYPSFMDPVTLGERERQVLHSDGHFVASRCYCLLTRFPFFQLNFDLLYGLLSLERVNFLKAVSEHVQRFGLGTNPYASRLRHTDALADGDDATQSAPRRPYAVHNYGVHPSQFLHLYLPTNAIDKTPVAFLVHGGFWKQCWNINNAGHTKLIQHFLSVGWAVVDVEYRRCGEEGGGFPQTQNDVMNALQCLTTLVADQALPLDLSQLVAIGHSAGGQLVLWLAHTAASLRGNDSLIVPRLVVGLAPCTDMIDGARRRLSDQGNACQLFMGCEPDSAKSIAKYQAASPRHLLPLKVPTIVVAGEKDDVIPVDMVRSFAFAAGAASAADAGIVYLQVEDAGHFDVVDPGSEAWRKTWAEICRFVAPVAVQQSPVSSHRPLVLDVLRKFQRLAVPEPGTVLTFDIDRDSKPSSLRFMCPEDDAEAVLMSNWTVSVAFKHLSLRNVLTILSLALLEQQILFVGSRIGILSAVVLSFIPLLRPFVWQCLFVPLLPSRMLSFLEAPVPFLMGMPVSALPSELSDDLVVVYVDDNKVRMPRTHLPTLPRIDTLHGQLKGLVKILESAYNDSTPLHITNNIQDTTANVVISRINTFLVGLTDNLKACSITDVDPAKQQAALVLKSAFLGMVPESERPFMTAFLETQMFAVRADEILGSTKLI
eukprot:c23663_g1_i1.p1 GENE.c23663_g1_i1~~c23663_g1_i1.p1  ORF type:complete len:945 (+),score=259.80 c23663_g1_i1:3-2837(+)